MRDTSGIKAPLTAQSSTLATVLQPIKPINGYFMSTIGIGVPVSHNVRALWDTGAMPTIICETALPLGTELLPSTVSLTGVSNKKLSILGEANICIELGNQIYQQLMVVVPSHSMQFPEESKIILGANFISQYKLIIDSATWTITRQGELVTQLLPAVIDSRLYSAGSSVNDASAPDTLPDHLLNGQGSDPVRQATETQRSPQTTV